MSTNLVALITGASSGIGLATARTLAQRGYALCITGPDQAGLDAATKQLPSKTLAVAGDLNNVDFTRELVEQTNQRLGRIDLLVNNAAWRELLTMRDVSLDSWERTLRICLTAPAFLAKHVAVGMESRGSGVIVNVSSIMAARGFGVATAYIAAKAGLDAVTRDLAVLYGPHGVRVIGVAPGAVDTALSADYPPDESKDAADMRSFSEDMIPACRWASAQEVAEAIVLLASAELNYMNGTTVVLDGGWSASLYPRSISDRFSKGRP